MIDIEKVLDKHGFDTSKLDEDLLDELQNKLDEDIDTYMRDYLLSAEAKGWAMDLAVTFHIPKKKVRS